MSKDKSKHSGWNDRYEGDDYFFGREPNDFLRSVAGEIPGDANVLCLADGEGRNGVYLAKLGHYITSVDRSSIGLEKAEKLAAANNVSITTIQADLSKYDLGQAQWDCVVSIFFHIPPKLQQIIYPRIIQSLKPDGLLILESYTPKHERDVVEGVGHTGQAAVLQLIARKSKNS